MCSFCCCNITALWETKKEQRLSYRRKYIEEFVWGTSLFWLHALFSMSFFVAFFVYYPSQVTHLLDGFNKSTHCYGWYSVWCRKYDAIFQFFQDIFKKHAVFQFFQRLWTPCEKLCKTLWNTWDGILFNFFNFAGTFLKFYEKLKQFHQYNKLSDDMLVLLNVNKSYGKWKYILLDNFSSHIFTHLTLQLLKQKSKIIFKNSQLKWQLSGHWPDSKVNLPILLNWKFRPICCTIPFTHTVYIWKLVITPLPHI